MLGQPSTGRDRIPAASSGDSLGDDGQALELEIRRQLIRAWVAGYAHAVDAYAAGAPAPRRWWRWPWPFRGLAQRTFSPSASGRETRDRADP